ncbi:MAG: hypothetical protein NC412_07340 [Roseburia sp.]|nr:hypothetical protein [Roseburia sp.]MCM1278570.1 hypothetical protein [Robinsoniella sp.]
MITKENKVILSIIGIMLLFLFAKPIECKAMLPISQPGIEENAVVISWNRQDAEATFDISVYMPVSSYWEGNTFYTNYSLKYIGSTSQTSYRITGLEGGRKYRTVITSYDKEGNPLYSAEYIAETLPKKAEVLNADLKWSSYYSYGKNKTMTYNLYTDIMSQDSADGYEIYLYNSKGKKVKSNKISAENSVSIRHTFYSLKENSYILKVRAYKKVNGKTCYGKWSSKVYVLRQPKCQAKWFQNKLYVRWEKIKGATGYDVYLCDKKKGTYKKIKSTGANTTMIYTKKYKNKEFKKGKQYYYYVVAKKKAKGKTYESALSYRFKVVIGK